MVAGWEERADQLDDGFEHGLSAYVFGSGWWDAEGVAVSVGGFGFAVAGRVADRLRAVSKVAAGLEAVSGRAGFEDLDRADV